MNKKLLVGLIIAAIVIIGGGIGYYYWQASADAFSQDYCAGVKGTQWKNCVQNMATWKKFMQGHSNTQFTRVINFMDNQANPSKTSATTTATTNTNTTTTTTPVAGQVTMKVTKAGVASANVAVKATVYAACTYTYSYSGAKESDTYFPLEFTGTTNTKGEFAVADADVITKAKAACVNEIKVIDDGHTATLKVGVDTPIRSDWYVAYTVTGAVDQNTLTASIFNYAKRSVAYYDGYVTTTKDILDGNTSDVKYAVKYNPGDSKVLTATLPL
ncbi:MAG: hypothetical protein WCP93_01510 [Candidatus Berkelbacteria bacterium]